MGCWLQSYACAATGCELETKHGHKLYLAPQMVSGGVF